jgi:hypothetical protein
MRILGIDPGAKPGYCLIDDAARVPRRYFKAPPLPVVIGVWAQCPVLPAGSVDRIAVELQWIKGPRKATRILTLAFTAGWQLARAQAALGGEPHALLVDEWRAALRTRGARKGVLSKRCEASLLPAEAALFPSVSPERRVDLYESIMIAWACWLAPKPWRIKP